MNNQLHKKFNIAFAVTGCDPTAWLLAQSFPEQTAAVTDESIYKCIMCARRSGKSVCAAIIAIIEACIKPNSTILILGLSFTQVKGAYTRTLQNLLRLLPIISKPYGGNEYRFPNGSRIVLQGASAGGYDRITRFQGDYYSLVVIDEPQDFANLYDLINVMIGPALVDVNGKLVLCGTPGYGKTYYYNIVHKNVVEANDGIDWSVFRWDRFANLHVKANSEERLAMVLKTNPAYMQTIDYRRMYGGEWVTDTANQIYHFNEHANVVKLGELPKFHQLRPSQKRCMLAIDMGWHDATAMQVAKHTLDEKVMYMVHCEQHTHMTIDQMMMRASDLIKEHQVTAVVIDEKPQVVESIRERFHIPVLPLLSFKHDKYKWQQWADSQLQRGMIKMVPDVAAVMKDEWENIVWDSDFLEQKGYPRELEKSSIPNHLSDAFLYCVRSLNQYDAMMKKHIEMSENDKFKLDRGFSIPVSKPKSDTEYAKQLRDLDSY